MRFTYTITSSSPYLSAPGGGLSCVGKPTTAIIVIDPDTPGGTYSVLVEGTTGEGGTCNTWATVTVALLADLTFGGVVEEDESYPGGFLAVNDDDDNGDGTADKDELGTATTGEDDLKPLSLSIPGGLSGTVTLTVSGPLELYQDADRGHPVTQFSWIVPDGGMPSTLYVEGTGPSSVRGASVTLEFAGLDGNTCADVVMLTVYKVESVTWEKAKEFPVNAELGTCENNGGGKIFPDKQDPNDNDPVARRKVDLVATITPVIDGRTVYFKVFDVDDPFDQLNPSMADVSLIDANSSGPDNRGAEGLTLPWTASKTTEADGKARVTFTVSMQPGNNYRAGASVLQDAVSSVQATQARADAVNPAHGNNGNWTGYSTPLVWSPMLTVWRKLHVETDTMVRPTFVQNTFSWTWTNPRQGPAPTQIVFDVNDPADSVLQTPTDQFLNGVVELRGPTGTSLITMKIIAYADAPGPDAVTVNVPDCGNGQSGLQCLQGATSGSAILSDDDLADISTFTEGIWGCDSLYANPTASLAPPDLSLLVDRYRPAYIEPIHETQASSTQGLTIFLRNWSETNNHGQALWDQALAARNLPVSTSNFWTAMVVSAWQAEEVEDADPDSEDQVGAGVTKGVNTHGDGSTHAISALGNTYSGSCADFKAVFGEAAFSDLERYTVVHELGHTLGLAHSDGGAMCVRGDCQREAFRPVSIVKLRSYTSP